jgi:hypothetical protein
MSPMKVSIALILALLAPTAALAHSFGRVYNLPVPFWLYAWGAAAALLASFLVVGYFATAKTNERGYASRDLTSSPWVVWAVRLHFIALLKVFSVFALVLCIATGLLGNTNPYGNFNMTFFWIVFVLGFAYLTALVGNLYAAINPWWVMTAAAGGVSQTYTRGIFRYPRQLAYWPAVVLYMVFIWLELFGRSSPASLAVLLSGYTLLNLLGVGLIGARDWFRYCEFFGVFLGLLARMAPIDYRPDTEEGKGHVRLRRPCAGLLEPRAENISMLVFVLFMLSSTAFDGLRETAVWQRLFWLDLYHAGLREWVGYNPLAAFPVMTQLYLLWQTFWLLVSPFLYLAVYFLFIAIAKWLTRSRLSLRGLCLEFALPLLPIALVYNITHYYTLIQSQGIKIISLASDPFGWGWDLFGTAQWMRYTIVPDAGTVWHVQVALIVLGHIVSVYLSHRVALRLFPSQRQAVISQIPMLLLMVIFTTVGLWILSQPLK